MHSGRLEKKRGLFDQNAVNVSGIKKCHQVLIGTDFLGRVSSK
jgi:hypothetical protein